MAVSTRQLKPSRYPVKRLEPFDVDRVREDFPILHTTVHGKPLVYLDNAATTQKPEAVIDTVAEYYRRQNANIHRGVHYLSQEATAVYDEVRERLVEFFNAQVGCEIVFVRGATEGINLVAQSYGRAHLGPGDEVLITEMEHHSNIVPWQIVCGQTGAQLKVAPIDGRGVLDMEAFEALLTDKTKVVAAAHVSNALGTANPVKAMVRKAHDAGAVVLVDGAQSAPHMPVDVRELGCDFFVCSAHKMYGPTGIGVLYGRAELLEAMPPYQGGGDMILSVAFDKTVYNRIPHRFEAGTPHIEGVFGFGAALDYIERLGLDRIQAHEQDLLAYGTEALRQVDGLRLAGTAPEKAGVLSFTMDAAHPHDIGTIADQHGVAIRVGHHCAQPVMRRFGVPATARASLGMYNTHAEIDALVDALHDVNEVFG